MKDRRRKKKKILVLKSCNLCTCSQPPLLMLSWSTLSSLVSPNSLVLEKISMATQCWRITMMCRQCSMRKQIKPRQLFKRQRSRTPIAGAHPCKWKTTFKTIDFHQEFVVSCPIQVKVSTAADVRVVEVDLAVETVETAGVGRATLSTSITVDQVTHQVTLDSYDLVAVVKDRQVAMSREQQQWNLNPLLSIKILNRQKE